MAMPNRLGMCSVLAAAATLAAAPGTPHGTPEALPAFAASVVYRGVLIAAPRAGGLVRIEAGELVPIEIGLERAQALISAIAVYEDEVWLGTAAGLLRVIVTSCGHRVETVLPEPVLAMRHGPDGLWVAGAARTHVVRWGAPAANDVTGADGVRVAGGLDPEAIEVERSLVITEVRRERAPGLVLAIAP